MDNFCVYKHTSPSGKVYIGITKQDPLRRWQNGNGYKLNEYFYRAIVKYGWANFRHEILMDGLTKEAACDMEIALIKSHDSTNPNKGYNIAPGGEHSSPTEATRQKIGAANRGKKPYCFGKHHSDETRQKLSEALKGHGVSDETRRKMSANRPKKKVYCVETCTVYVSTIEAERQTGIRHDGISKCCRNVPKYKTAGGFHWKWADQEEGGQRDGCL